MKNENSIRNEKDLLEHLDAKTRLHAEKEIYDSTDCGAWIAFNADGITLGTIVEGSEACFEADPLVYPFPVSALDEALEWLEGESSTAWHEAND